MRATMEATKQAGCFAVSLALAALSGSTASAGYTTSLGAENGFLAPAGWSVGDAGSTYQQWDAKTTKTGNPADQGHQTNPAGLTAPTHSVKDPGFVSGSDNFYSWQSDYGATADVSNHGGSSGSGSYGSGYGTHAVVQTGSTQSDDSDAWGTYTELVAGHGVGNFWETMQLVDLRDNPIPGGANTSALQIAEVSYQAGVSTSAGPVEYQELIYEFWLPGYTDDFRVDWDQVIHGTIDTLRVDSMIAMEAEGGGSPFALTAVPEPAATGLLGAGAAALLGAWGLRRRRK